MDMNINVGIMITLVTMIVSFAFGYGILSNRVKNVECKLSEIDDIKDDIRSISDTLQRLVGQFETYIKMSRGHNE